MIIRMTSLPFKGELGVTSSTQNPQNPERMTHRVRDGRPSIEEHGCARHDQAKHCVSHHEHGQPNCLADRLGALALAVPACFLATQVALCLRDGVRGSRSRMQDRQFKGPPHRVMSEMFKARDAQNPTLAVTAGE